jgi:hypothetical protein
MSSLSVDQYCKIMAIHARSNPGYSPNRCSSARQEPGADQYQAFIGSSREIHSFSRASIRSGFLPRGRSGYRIGKSQIRVSQLSFDSKPGALELTVVL